MPGEDAESDVYWMYMDCGLDALDVPRCSEPTDGALRCSTSSSRPRSSSCSQRSQMSTWMSSLERENRSAITATASSTVADAVQRDQHLAGGRVQAVVRLGLQVEDHGLDRELAVDDVLRDPRARLQQRALMFIKSADHDSVRSTGEFRPDLMSRPGHRILKRIPAGVQPVGETRRRPPGSPPHRARGPEHLDRLGSQGHDPVGQAEGRIDDQLDRLVSRAHARAWRRTRKGGS